MKKLYKTSKTVDFCHLIKCAAQGSCPKYPYVNPALLMLSYYAVIHEKNQRAYRNRWIYRALPRQFGNAWSSKVPKIQILTDSEMPK